MKEYLLEEVFGSSRDVPLNYTNRDSIDDLFKESLRRKKHIIIFGSSKQGKTCLRKNHLRNDEYISIQCSNKHSIEDLNELILKQAGFKLTVSEKKGEGGKIKTNLSFGAKFLSFFEGKAEAGYEKESKKEIEIKDLEIDLGDVNDIISALKGILFSKFILLEDFHYLNKETQSDFAFALKAYYDNSSLLFILIGVWLEENRLIGLNGDLSGRVVSVNADKWTESDLRNVIEKGSTYLNIKFASSLIDRIIEESYDNVYFVQEVCYNICKEFQIKQTYPHTTSSTVSKTSYAERNLDDGNEDEEIDDGRYMIPNDRYYVPDSFDIKKIIKDTVDQHSGRYNTFITHLAIGVENDSFEILKWLLMPIITADSEILLSGIKLSFINDTIKSKHPSKDLLHLTLIKKVLQELGDFQLQKKITPNILDYSEIYQTLQIVDKGFIIWLEHQNRNDILKQIGIL